MNRASAAACASSSCVQGVASLGDGAPIFVRLDVEIDRVGVGADPEFVGEASNLLTGQFMRLHQVGIGRGFRQRVLHEWQYRCGNVESTPTYWVVLS
jgi:hypothetical protein